MSFEPKTQAFNSLDQCCYARHWRQGSTLGGINVLPFYTFDAPIKTRRRSALRSPTSAWRTIRRPVCKDFYAGCQTVADMAKARGDDGRRIVHLPPLRRR